MTVALLAFFAAAAGFGADAGKPDFAKMLKAIDAQSSFAKKDFSAKMKMVSVDPEKGTETRAARTFRRDNNDSFLILFLEPESQLGQGYLRIDENLWLYDPESRKFTHTSMKENMQGTDAKNSDFRQSTLATDYTVASSAEGKLGVHDVWILDLEAVNNEVTYPYKKVFISKTGGFLLKSEDYSLSRRLLRTSYYTSYVQVGSSYIADSILYVDALIKGKKTQITMTEASEEPIPDSVFTKTYVERVNR
jgi:outer membrane lipoprotein-sorting protein